MDRDKLEPMLKDSFGKLIQQGYWHGDPKLDNVHLMGDRIMILDLEDVVPLEDITPEEALDVWTLTILDESEHYRNNLIQWRKHEEEPWGNARYYQVQPRTWDP